MAEDNYCPVHKMKCLEIEKAHEKVDELQKNKLSVAMTRIIITVIALSAAAFFYRVESQQTDAAERHTETMATVMRHVAKVNEKLSEHINMSNELYKQVIHVQSEVKVNQKKVMRKLELEFEELPHYGRPFD